MHQRFMERSTITFHTHDSATCSAERHLVVSGQDQKKKGYPTVYYNEIHCIGKKYVYIVKCSSKASMSKKVETGET